MASTIKVNGVDRMVDVEGATSLGVALASRLLAISALPKPR